MEIEQQYTSPQPGPNIQGKQRKVPSKKQT